MKKITLEVTQDDIDRGLPYSSGFSPVARAFHRAGFLDVIVDDAQARIIHGGIKVMANLPKEAREFARAFDEMEDVKPFSFEVYLSATERRRIRPNVNGEKDEADCTLEDDKA